MFGTTAVPMSGGRKRVKRARLQIALAVAAVGVLGVAAVAVATDKKQSVTLTGYEEVPAISSTGTGEFHATIDKAGETITYRLTYSGLESDVTQAHIHMDNPTNAGPIIVWICSNLGNGPAGTPLCPAQPATIDGVITATSVSSSAANGISAGEMQEFVRAMRAGVTYVNVHTKGHGGGEIRAQLDGSNGGRGKHGD
jgi:hypothetical protein